MEKAQLPGEDATSDCISRKGLKESLLFEDYETHDYCFPCKEIMKRIDEQQSVQSDHIADGDKKGDHLRDVTKKVDVVSRQAVIEIVDFECGEWRGLAKTIAERLSDLPSAQPESYKEKLKEIADALSEKFAYMNTCLNERDIILGYLGVKRPSKTHCNTDCTNTKCESHPLSSAQSYTEDEIQKMQDLESAEIEKAFQLGREDALSEIVRCKDCKHWRAGTVYSYCEKLYRMGVQDIYCYMTSDDDFCSMAERR